MESIVVLTGAGISAESGLATFRDADGLWQGYKIEEVCTPTAFKSDPAKVQSFYNQRRQELQNNIQPNAAHIALAEFARQYPGRFTLITQNVDNLHERAGSEKVLHMHGELLKVRCQRTFRVYHWTSPILPSTPCPCCNQTKTLRPHIVWFDEIPFYMLDINEALQQCDRFIAIGTSGQVQPAASFVEMAKSCNAQTVSLNYAPANGDFEQHIQGLASQIVPDYFGQLLSHAVSQKSHKQHLM
ncbi:NAD-dependent deacylase [Marinagarivorans cellulosilyticus]|uniref:NAD-dependent protein deacylase n=1 Tax=Marinagarivorans cellulosilyticus TaxID=2721545 RepID=A0AAN2BL25_9GAMM|nr:NAD-dependent deacylase [Marinagarivorans cellulosilyticus]BCD98582.1 NAD-dependent deacetylase [Marinagarivorans cellulosilyticus]